jgi:glycosyltransferase involved in cell wall biosynthesis
LKILLEMRPALDGHAGIPQETRLLFRGLAQIKGMEVEGLIQSGNQVLAKGLPVLSGEIQRGLSVDKQINRLSRVVVSLQKPGKRDVFARVVAMVQTAAAPIWLTLSNFFCLKQTLSGFDPTHFRDFVWRALFSKTLPLADFDTVTRANFRVARVPYGAMHACALATRKLGHAFYPTLDTRGVDVMIAETPYPGEVASPTKLVVRYHDAFPVLMPHTIIDKSYHQASHYHALRKNVASGAYFACVSEATRRDLLSIFPQAQAVTIHNMLSHHYFAEASSPVRIPEIITTRLNNRVRARPPTHKLPINVDMGGRALDYLLMVSTIEPRKNHTTLLAAWEQLRSECYSDLKLVIVGSLGWEHKPITRKFRPWLERGDVFLLEDVPSAELRLLYRHASATVCPSLAEGFDFSGVEAMRCGGALVASDIPVHRDVFDLAAEYCSPYSASEVAQAIVRVIDPANAKRRDELVAEGAKVAARYLPECILPQWQEFLGNLQG